MPPAHRKPIFSLPRSKKGCRLRGSLTKMAGRGSLQEPAKAVVQIGHPEVPVVDAGTFAVFEVCALL